MNRSLKQEKARNDAVIAQLRSILSTAAVANATKTGDSNAPATVAQKDVDLSFLTSSPAARQLRVGITAGSDSQHTPLTTNTTFILSQLPALQAVLKQLRPKLASLPKSADLMDVESKRDERKEYIESRIKLHLERTGQLTRGSDANAVVAGRRIDISEARALETVAGMLSRGGTNSE